MSAASSRGALAEVAWLFLKLGATAFGGPAAHVAIMEREVVRDRRWVTREEFLDLLGATNLIPGPNSTELAIHLGLRRAGWPGLLVAGVCFILPATLLVMAIAWGYAKYGVLPEAGRVLRGVQPVILAIIVQALWSLARTAVKSRILGALGLLVVALSIAGVNELLVLFGAGFVLTAPLLARRSSALFGLGGLPLLGVATPATAAAAPVTLGALFWFFVKVGSVLFGSGYVLLAFLHADLVERWHWLSETQLLDAIAVGQFTPGPVFTTATFIGYLLGGPPGAILATVGIFLPAFFFVAVSAPFLPRLRASPVAARFLDGLNVASLALMAVVAGQLARVAVADAATALLAVTALLLLLRTRVNSAWLVLAGGVLGLLLA